MKTKISRAFLLTFLVLLMGSSLKAQTMTFTNTQGCDVNLGYELRDNSCNVCQNGTILVPANSTNVTLSLCANYFDICIWVVDVVGCSVAYNHMTYSPICCQNSAGAGGTTCTAAVGCANTPWTGTLLPG